MSGNDYDDRLALRSSGNNFKFDFRPFDRAMLVSLGRRIAKHAFCPKGVGSSLRSNSTLSSPTLSDPENVRNIALLAHIDSGKTTLTESILTASSYKPSAGTVDTGSTTTDFLPAERERGITIQSASIPVSWQKWTFNLIDTPGHADFGMEVESASRVIDGAVVLMDAVEGVESQTKGVWTQLDRHQVPTRFMFVNKLDRAGASLPSSISSILSHRLHPAPTLLTLPVASFDPSHYTRGEPSIEGLVDLVKWEVWRWPNNQTFDSSTRAEKIALPSNETELAQHSLFPPSHPLSKELLPAREALLDSLSLHSPDLESAILDCPPDQSPYLSVEASQVVSSLRSLVAQRKILPVFCGAAAKHIGTELLLDYVGELLASPRDVRLEGAIESGSDVQMLAWKVVWDKRKGWMTFVRVYSGSLTRNVTLVNTSTREKERISKILLLYADEPREVDSLPFGSVGVLLGLKHTRTGDTLIAATLDHQSHRQHKPVKGKPSLTGSPLALRSIVPPPAVISASVIPQAHADIQPVNDALLALTRTDPSLRVTEDTTEGQTLVHGLGALHLEIAEGRLRDEWAVRVSFGRRRVTYREGYTSGPVEVDEVLERDVGGTRVSARVRLAVRALNESEGEGDPAWGGNVVCSADGTTLQAPATTSDTAASGAPIDPVLLGIQTALSASPHTSLAFSRAHITIVDAPPTNMTNPLAAGASTHALRAAIMEAGAGAVMEPYVNVRVRVGEEAVGKVVKDLTECGGEIADLGLEAMDIDSDTGAYDVSRVYIPPLIVSPASGVSRSTKSASGAGAKRTVHAVAPLSRMLDYSNRLRALSAGTGSFEMSSAGFREVGDVRRLEILSEIGRA